MYFAIGLTVGMFLFLFWMAAVFSDRLRKLVIEKGLLPFTDMLKDLDRGFEPRDADSMWVVLLLWFLFGLLFSLLTLLAWPAVPFGFGLSYVANSKFIRK